MFEAAAGFDPQLRFAVPSGHFFDIDDIPISNLPDEKTAPAGRNEVFGIKPGELPEQQHQSENVRQRGDHEFHKNGHGTRHSPVVGAPNENRGIARDGSDDPEVHPPRPSPVRQRNRFWELEHEFEDERERDDDNQYGESECGDPTWHPSVPSPK